MIAFLIIAASLPLLQANTDEAATYLMCDPVERLVEVQVCDYSNSAYGGICFYELRQRPFRTNSTDLRSLSGVTPISLPPDKERELRTFLSSHLTKVEHRPLFDYGVQAISQHVPPYQRFTVQQKMIVCGPYAVPTPEDVPSFDVPSVDRWMVHLPSKKQFYISSEETHHSAAKHKCTELRGRLALLDTARQFEFVASIAVMSNLRSPIEHGITYLQWANGSPKYSIMTFPRGTNDCVKTLFHLRAFVSVGCDSTMRYVCEKNSDVA